MFSFGGVQFIDPDGLFWFVVYLIPALATGLVAFRPQLTAKTPIIVLYGIALVAGFVGTAYFWPRTTGF